MSEIPENDDDDGIDAEDVLVNQITPDPETAEWEFLEILSELENTEVEELPSIYTEVDHFVEMLFKTPPSQRAQMSISFSYAGYRVTIHQTGVVEVVPVKASFEE